MDKLDELLRLIRPIADENCMEAFIVGSKAYCDGDECWPDGALLKVCPRGVRTRVLLEIELSGYEIKLYKHRNFELTAKYKGRAVTNDWLVRFIRHNQNLANEIIAEYGKSKDIDCVLGLPAPKKAAPPEYIQKIKAERHNVTCACRGEVEDCVRCYGKGYYTTDGLGNAIE